MTPTPTNHSTGYVSQTLQLEKLYVEEKIARVAALKQQKFEFLRMKISYRSVFETDIASRHEALMGAAKLRQAAVEGAALKARQAAAGAQLAAKQAAQIQAIEDTTSRLVSSAIEDAMRSVEYDEATRSLWQLKELEDQAREEWLEEEVTARQSILASKRADAQKALRAAKLQKARSLGRQANQVTKLPFHVQLSNLVLKEDVVRKREVSADERLEWAKLQHAMLKDFKRLQAQPQVGATEVITQASNSEVEQSAVAGGFVSGLVRATNIFREQQVATHKRQVLQLKREEEAKRRFQYEYFATQRARMQQEMRQAEDALWEQWAIEQIRQAETRMAESAKVDAKHEALLEHTAEMLAMEAISEAMIEVKADHQRKVAKFKALEHDMMMKRDKRQAQKLRKLQEQAAATKPTMAAAPSSPRGLKKRLSLRAKLSEVQQAAVEHAIAESPNKCPRPPRGPAEAPRGLAEGRPTPEKPPTEKRPNVEKPAKTGRRIYVRKQAAKMQKMHDEVAAGRFSPRTADMLMKQKAVERTMVAADQFTLPPINSPFNVHTPALLI